LSETRERGYWDAVGAEWTGAQTDRLWRAHTDALYSRLMDRWLPPRSRRALKTDLFDEAVAGGFGGSIARRCDALVGIDTSATVVERAAAGHPGIETAVADVRALPFPDGRFDLVVSPSTLDHFTSAGDLQRAVAELHRVLEPGGTLVVALDNLANPLVALRNALPFELLRRSGLVPYFVGASRGPRGLRRLLAECGFEVVGTDTLVHVPRVLAVPAARLVARHAGAGMQRRFLAALMRFEALGRLPTRFLTGHMVVAVAVRRPQGA
jgi:SAM-dependent methyltransferase